MQIIDDLLPEQLVKNLEWTIMAPESEFPWEYNSATSSYSNYESEKIIDTPQFVHNTIMTYNNNIEKDYVRTQSPLYPYIDTTLMFIAKEFNMTIESILRVKANLLLPQKNYPVGTYHIPHKDYNRDEADNIWTFLYYVNDSDGDTYFFNDDLTIKDQVSPRRGRGCLFRSHELHASSSPVDSDRRVVINYCFREHKNVDS